nr:hypothetical protein [Tanacetum cinerariifolium]
QKSGDRHQPTSQQSSHRNHGHNYVRHVSDRRGGSDNHRSNNNNYSGSNNMLNFKYIQSPSTHEHDPNTTVPQDYNASFTVPCLFIHILCYSLSLYPFTEHYAQPYFFSCLIRQMVNTRTDADLSAAVQNALQTLLLQAGPSDSGGNPPPVTIYTWL